MYGIIVQARMSSTRFPGKVLYSVNNKPLLQYTLESLIKAHEADLVVVATSSHHSDFPVVELCQSLKIPYHCGDLNNVSLRFLQTIQKFGFTAFVRISGDSPLLDYRLIDLALKIYKAGNFDVVTNVLKRTFPKGQSVEVICSEIFRQAYNKMISPEELEHVTPYFYSNCASLIIKNFEAIDNLSHIQLSVDTPKDMDIFKQIISIQEKPHYEYNWQDLAKIASGIL